MLAAAVDVKFQHFAARRGDRLLVQIDLEAVALAGLAFAEQAFDHGGVEYDGQDAVLEAVVVEDVGVGRRDDGADAIVFQRPRRMLAARSAAEVVTRQQHRSTRIARKIQHERGIRLARGGVHARLAVVEITPLVEQVGAKAGALDRLQELLGDDGVGVDVGAVERHHQPVERGESLHC